MPFGLVNSGSTYQRLMDETLRDVKQADPYVDDICIHSHSFTKHISDLRRTFECLKRVNLQLRRDKCTFGYYKGEFLGHLVSKEGHCPSPRLVEKIRNAEKPKNKEELLRFLGLANFYREYVLGFADVAEPLYALTKESTEWSWTASKNSSFEELKYRLTKDPVTLAFPNWEREFLLQVDASSVAVGGVLSQRDGAGHARPLAFFSSGLTPAQKNYSAGELECWALIAASRKFHKYLQAAPSIRFISDHNPLVWLRLQKDPRGKFARWIQELESLDYCVEYIKGSENLPADYLSRLESPIDWEINDEVEHFERHVFAVVPPEDILGKIKAGQREDSAITSSISHLQSGKQLDQGQFKRQVGMTVTNGLLCGGKKNVVPQKLKNEVISLVHNEGHLGIDNTTRLIRNNFFWKRMDRDVEEFCRGCLICQRNKPKHQPKEKLTPIHIAKRPREVIAYDVAT